MSFNTTNAITNVTGSVTTTAATTSPLMLPSSTQLHYCSGVLTGTGSVADSYTIPAGKRFILTGVQHIDHGTIEIYKNDGTTLIGKFIFSTLSSVGESYNPIYNIPSYGFWVYTAGQIVKTKFTNGSTYLIYGIIENV